MFLTQNSEFIKDTPNPNEKVDSLTLYVFASLIVRHMAISTHNVLSSRQYSGLRIASLTTVKTNILARAQHIFMWLFLSLA